MNFIALFWAVSKASLESVSKVMSLFELLTAILSAMMWGELKCQWSMSRPLLGLILLQEDTFNEFKNEIIRQQPIQKQLAFTAVLSLSSLNERIRKEDGRVSPHLTQLNGRFRK